MWGSMMWIMGGFTSADWTDEPNQNSALFGYAVSTAGDVNADGYADVLIGAPYYDNGGQFDEGRAYLYLGSAAGLANAPAWTAETNQSSSLFSWSVGGGGDVNGDGFDDVIVGAWLYDNVQFDEGRAFVYYGSATGLEANAAWTAEDDQSSSFLGYSVAMAGDVNGDGFDDVIAGAYAWDNVQFDEGRAMVWHGSATGLASSPSWVTEPNQSSALFGYSVAGAGDVNGDGFDDVIVGAPLYESGGQFDEGSAFVYLGSATGLGTTPAWTAESNINAAQSSFYVASAGDVNADGYDDVITGAPFLGNGSNYEGRASVYLGSATGLAAAPVWTFEAGAPYQYVGWSVGSAGDVNNDGFDDVVAGSLYWDAGTLDEGAALVFLGTATGPSTNADFIVDSGQGYSYFGSAVASAGDVDGDGFDDLLVGARYYDNVEFDEGRAYLYRGTCADPIDSDGDSVGDLCDVCVGFDDRLDGDVDGMADGCDVCPTLYDPMQLDDDYDGIGDACDPCPANSPDVDSDGFCAAQECDDNNGTVYPGAEELCDGLDNACSGAVPPDEIDEDGDGEAVCEGDCDDANIDLFSGQTEVCNGKDDNCDGLVGADEADVDGDHSSVCDGDCDDTNVQMAPHLYDLCGDDLDNDCDGDVDQTCGTDEATGGGASGCSCNAATGGAAATPLLFLAMFLPTARRRRGNVSG